jgi:hypothetical protein
MNWHFYLFSDYILLLFFPVYRRQRDQWLTERTERNFDGGRGRNLTEDCAAKYGGPAASTQTCSRPRNFGGKYWRQFWREIWRMDGIEKQIHHTVSGYTGIHHTLKWKYWEREGLSVIFLLQGAWLGCWKFSGSGSWTFFTAPAVLVRDIASLSPRVHFLSSQGPSNASIPTHAWSKLVFVTFHPLSKAKETLL